MRLAYSFLALVWFMLTLTCATPSPLQERLPPIKSTNGQNYALLKPLSAAISYIYYVTPSLSVPPVEDDHSTINTNTRFNTNNNNNSITIFIKERNNDRTKNIIINNASSSTIDVNHQNGPVTALALVLFFCVLTF